MTLLVDVNQLVHYDALVNKHSVISTDELFRLIEEIDYKTLDTHGYALKVWTAINRYLDTKSAQIHGGSNSWFRLNTVDDQFRLILNWATSTNGVCEYVFVGSYSYKLLEFYAAVLLRIHFHKVLAANAS